MSSVGNKSNFFHLMYILFNSGTFQRHMDSKPTLESAPLFLWVNISRWDQQALRGAWKDSKVKKTMSKLRVSSLLQLDVGRDHVYEYTLSSIVVSIDFVILLHILYIILILYWPAMRGIPENTAKARIILHESIGRVQFGSSESNISGIPRIKPANIIIIIYIRHFSKFI